jgi:hypothetical protein
LLVLEGGVCRGVLGLYSGGRYLGANPMSDFEMIMVFNGAFDGLLSSFTTFLTIVFAFLVASTILAARLTRTLAGIAVGLFSLASAFFIMQAWGVAINLGLIVEQMKTAVAAGRSGLGWLGFVGNDLSLGVNFRFVAVLMALTFVAALVFFFHQRRVS